MFRISSSFSKSSTLTVFLTYISLLLVLTCRLVSAQQQQQLEEAPAQYTDDAAFRKTVLDVSNTYRRQHNATRLRWNESLAEYAREWSAGCVFEHSMAHTARTSRPATPNASAAILAWGHERTTYDFRSGDFSRETGHFTQLVWKATTSMGCGRTQCDGRGGGGAPGWYLVCSYHPRGNMLGAFVDNVQPRIPDDEQEQQQPDEGPDSPEVPDQGEQGGEEKCPQGWVCSSAPVRSGHVGALWVALGVGLSMGVW